MTDKDDGIRILPDKTLGFFPAAQKCQSLKTLSAVSFACLCDMRWALPSYANKLLLSGHGISCGKGILFIFLLNHPDHHLGADGNKPDEQALVCFFLALHLA